jgi:hypothetical protein
MQIINLKKLLPKTLIVLLSLAMIGGMFKVTSMKNFWVTNAEARRGGAAGVGGGPVGSGPGVGTAAGGGGGPVGSGPGYGGARVVATPRSHVYPGPGAPGPRGIADPRGPIDPRNPYR